MLNRFKLIFLREYFLRIKRKSFLLTTFLTPLLLVSIFGAIFWFSINDLNSEKKIFAVIDLSQKFEKAFISDLSQHFDYNKIQLKEAKEMIDNGKYDGIISIPDSFDIENPANISFYTKGNPSLKSIEQIEKIIEKEISDQKLIHMGISIESLEKLKTDISLQSINLTEGGKEIKGSSEVASALGYISAILIYIFIFTYGSMCMRGVTEEKTSRIVEILISSVKPFELMIGKIIGIASVGLTQLILWITLIFVIGSIGLKYIDTETQEDIQKNELLKNDNTSRIETIINESFESINIPLTIFCFIFYFIGGYFLYSSLFAAVGAAIDNDADAQQFMFPITIPIIASISTLSIVIMNPNGSFSFWMSMIPFTSPIIMMMRVPFGLPMWELVLSMIFLIIGFIFNIWIAGRIFRIGILMHGTKVNYKILIKWLFMKY